MILFRHRHPNLLWYRDGINSQKQSLTTFERGRAFQSLTVFQYIRFVGLNKFIGFIIAANIVNKSEIAVEPTTLEIICLEKEEDRDLLPPNWYS